MKYLKIIVAATLVLPILLATAYPGNAAQSENTERRLAAKCKAELRKCNSHCNLVYESRRANRVCRDRCEDAYFVCKARPM